MKADFPTGKEMLKDKTGDVVLVPIVVTTFDVHDFDFSVPVFKSWLVSIVVGEYFLLFSFFFFILYARYIYVELSVSPTTVGYPRGLVYE